MRYSIVFLLISIPLLFTSASVIDTPIHRNVPPMATTSPHTIVTSVSTAHQSEMLTIRIKSVLSELNFGGFIVHAHSTSRPDKFLGRFISSRVGLMLSSFDGEDNIATYHAYPGSEDEVELQWQAPNDYVGEIFFNATIAQDYDKSWVEITSSPVEIVPSEADTSESFFTSSIVPPNDANQLSPSAKAEQRNSDSIYDGCGTTKTCVGVPNNCIGTQSCQAVTTAVLVGSKYIFELQSLDERSVYVALGLSRDDQMGEDSVVECVNEAGTVRAYASYNERRSNTREGVPQTIISLLESSFVDGLIYCKLERQAVTTVLGLDFDLTNENYHIFLAFGFALTSTSISRHYSRVASTQPLEIIERQVDGSIYDGCGSRKTCFGLPALCVEGKSCQGVVTATVIDGRHQFELQSAAANISYIALGLSTDTLMGNDSVVECVLVNGTVLAYASWNERRTNYREGVPQNMITLLASSFTDGTIYCKYEREAVTTVRELEFNLLIEDFHFLIALGTTLTQDDAMLTRHDIGRLASPEPLAIIRQGDSIYFGCDTNKICFGKPDGCIASESCQAIVAVTVEEDDERYQFEMQSGVANVGYVSFALSMDEYMGTDSVIECLVNGGNVSAFHSWNNPRPSYTNTRVGVSQEVFTLLSSSYTDGTIYCKVERQASTVVGGYEFNLAREAFYFLLAIGTSFTETAILTHNLGRWASDEQIELPGTDTGSAPHVVKVSAIAFVVWLLATSCTQFLRAV